MKTTYRSIKTYISKSPTHLKCDLYKITFFLWNSIFLFYFLHLLSKDKRQEKERNKTQYGEALELR